MPVTKRSLKNRRPFLTTLPLMGALLLVACSHTEVTPPPPHEFGLEARLSESGMYTATAVPAEPIDLGRMHGWTLVVKDRDGRSVGEAEITVDGPEESSSS